MDSALASASLWHAVRPPTLALAPVVTPDMADDAALDIAYRWHAALEALPADVMSPAARGAAYEGMPAPWREDLTPTSAVQAARGPVVSGQFGSIAAAPHRLSAALAWNIGEMAWLFWLAHPAVRPVLGTPPESEVAGVGYARALLGGGETAEALEAFRAAALAHPDSVACWGSLGFAALVCGRDTPDDAALAARAFTQALDALPAGLRPSAAAFLVGYAAIADGLAGKAGQAVTRLAGLIAQGDATPELRYQACRWASATAADVGTLAPTLEALLLLDPAYYLRALVDPVFQSTPTGIALVAQVGAAQATALADVQQQAHQAQRAVLQAARLGIRLPVSAAADPMVSATLTTPLDVVAARHALHVLAPLQRAALTITAEGPRAWEQTEQRLLRITEKLQALPKEMSFRVPVGRGAFAETVAMDDASDWRQIEGLVNMGCFADAIQYGDTLASQLTQAYGVALAEYGALIGHGLGGMAIYGDLVQRGRGGWTPAVLQGLRDGGREATEVAGLLTSLSIARDESRVTPQFAKAWTLLQQHSQRWVTARRLLGPLAVLPTVPTVTVRAGSWVGAEVYLADEAGYPVAGVPVYARLAGSDGVTIRWPYRSLVPGYAVSLATGKALVAVSAVALADDMPRGTSITAALWLGVTPDATDVELPITVVAP